MTGDDVTRRGWLLRVSGAAALSCFEPGGALAADSTTLPPGLYQPSVQHLAHILKAPAAAPATSPHFFSPEDFALVLALVALILEEERSAPVVREIASWMDLIADRAADVRQAARSLSAAHRRLAIDYYGADTVRELETEDVQQILRNGLAELHAGDFAKLDTPAQYSHLARLEDAGDAFLVWMKHRTLDGFYTSREGLAELDYKGNAFYTRCPGCDHEGGHH